MAMPEPMVLDGCAPTPLASYLKALGVLRLLSSPSNNVDGEAADPHVRGWWENERFHLRTTLSRDDILSFFLEDYAPSPIIAPWNGRAGFLEGDGQEDSTRAGAALMRRFEARSAPRFANMRRTIERVRANDKLARLNHLRARTKALGKELKTKTLQGEERKSREEEKKRVEKEEKLSKRVLLPALRSATEPEHVSYVDACYVLSTEEAPMPLLGSGGNDGSRDFGVNFADALTRLFGVDDGCAAESGKSSLDGALLGGGRLAHAGTMGQFSPGQGGSNATTGYAGENPLNPWDVVLAMEGTIAFAGALTRSWGAAGGSRASFPFTFEPVGAAAGSFSPEDPNRPRGEIWVPLWKKPAAFTEVMAIFSEGRLTLGDRTARTGLDAARAVTQIGLARGITSFERYSLIQPDTKMPYQATPLGRIATPDQPRPDVIIDLEDDGWLEQARRLAGNRRTAPSRARHAMRRLEDSLFQMTDAARAPEGTRNALMAIGGFVDWLTTNRKAREELNPPPRLSRYWIVQADDGTPEFRVAAALAGLGLPPSAPSGRPAHVSDDVSATDPASTSHDETDETQEAASRSPVGSALPMAAHFAPIDEERFFGGTGLRRRRAWATDRPPDGDRATRKEGGRDRTQPGHTPVVRGAGSLVSNMIAVLERRMVEATMRGLPDKPLAGAAFAKAADVAAFIEGDFDDARCAALLAGLVWATPARLENRSPHDGVPVMQPPFAYAVLKPLFSPDAALRRTGALDGEARLPLPPGLLARLRAGGGSRDGRATDEAVRAALFRARASGLASPFDPAGSYGHAATRIGAGVRADRLAASLLIPIGDRDLKALLARAWPDALPGDGLQTEETTDDA